MCAPTWKYTGDIDQQQTRTKANRYGVRFMQELFFDAIMGVSLVALIFGFVILIKVLVG